MKKFIITEEDRNRIRGLYEQSTAEKEMYKKMFGIFYKDGDTELKLPTKYQMGDVKYTYELTTSAFWNTFDEYFKNLGQTPPLKVFIGDEEILRPK